MFVISHSAALDLATQVQAAILNSFSEAIVWITDTTPAIGSHAGPGGLGIAVLDTGWVEERILKDGAA
jgi:fatty acid-binding protein DegV